MSETSKTLFRSLELSSALLRMLQDIGYAEMTTIQAAALPPLLAGKDLLGQAKTGSGKTAAFVLPLLQKIDVVDVRPQALILCPTRELCDQVIREVQKFSKNMPQLRIGAMIGGQSHLPQEETLVNGVHLVVGTPGRTLEFLKNEKLNVTQLRTLVLDEADRLLDKGFAEELGAIRALLPRERQTVLFSATFSEKFDSTWLKPDFVKIKIEDSVSDRPNITSYLYEAEKPEKLGVLFSLLREHPSESTVVFCRTKASVGEIGASLIAAGASAQILHSDLNQSQRDRAVAMFRNQSVRILVATDVAARGIDIDTLSLVINFDLPPTIDVFIHRIGRTGRAGRSGVAASIATEYEREFVKQLEASTGQNFARRGRVARSEDAVRGNRSGPKPSIERARLTANPFTRGGAVAVGLPGSDHELRSSHLRRCHSRVRRDGRRENSLDRF